MSVVGTARGARLRWRWMLAAVCLFAAAVIGVGAPAPAAADVDDFAFASMHADYTLGLDAEGHSTLHVVETFVAVFPEEDQNRGMRRVLPDTYNGQPLFPEFVSVTDGEGNPRPVDVEQDDGVFIMTSAEDDFVHGEQTYVFTYDLENVTWRFPDTGDEFYWDINGLDWRQPFGDVSVTLTVEPELAGSLTGAQACYAGGAGVTDSCRITANGAAGGAVVIEAGGVALEPYETVTVAVGFDEDTFVLFDTSYLASPWGWAQGFAGLGMIGVVVFAIVHRARLLADAPGRPTIIAEFTPPKQVDALEGAVLLGRTSKAIPAEVLEQAIVGSIRILEGEKKLFGGARLQAQLLDRTRADGDGRMLLDGLFGPSAAPGAVYEFGKQDRRFSTSAQKIIKAANLELAYKGLRRPVANSARALPVLLSLGVVVLAVVLGFVAISSGADAGIPVLVMIGSVALSVVTMLLVSRKPLSAEGSEVRDHLKGLETFIAWAEADRIRMLQSPAGAERVSIDTGDRVQMIRLYETLLPYAVVFGQEKKWAQQLAVMYGVGVAPYWYYGTSGFNAMSFSTGIASLSAAASSSSSTSGGSSGGGSAGGGGGGGGGGGV
ncbi:DUF2207 domain-containing protein [Microbacterium aquimaris]|uniref:DUF2207 domain-containing protein n=1 Tax=Microbacterium aquimaris TaxID=459816 RepID=UPI002AD4A643|nr:DUF2207 domain-containing protein [Microbacterium aquimaris]MDZ8276758.1 DUF2207 domain-containing protein [Microbacterium aquimaris]